MTDFAITFTPGQFIGAVLAICGVIVTLSSAVTVIVSGIDRAKAPEKLQNDRLDLLENEVKRLDTLINKDSSRMAALEDGNRVTQKAILALLSHGIDGNDIAAMKDAKRDMEEYLIGKTTPTR